MKILITGGHITPALAVIHELLQTKNVDIIVIGRKYQPNSHNSSFEFQSIDKLNLPFIHLEAGRLSRILSINSLRGLAKFPGGILESIKILKKQKPDKVVSFGGYIGLSVSLAAWLSHIPVYTHEQTIIPGLSNKIISKFAKKIFISFPETSKYFKRKTLLSGNPLRPEIYQTKNKLIEINKTKPLIYITGGSLGAHSINTKIEEILPQLLTKYSIIHQIGDVKEYNDFERLSKFSSEDYHPLKHVLDDEIGYIYSNCDLVISRAGANTILELIALKKISVLIPLPWSANGEQQAQANLLQRNGVAEIFDQTESSSLLYELIQKILNHKDNYENNFTKLASYIHPDSANVIAHEIIG